MAKIKAPWRIANGIGAPNGVGRRPFDRWFRYPAGFSAETMRQCFDMADLKEGDLLLEPFAGAATAGTEAVREGLTFRGLEAHPLIAELAQLKFERPGDPAALLVAGRTVAVAPSASDVDGELTLVQKSFPPDVLRALVGMRSAIAKSHGSPWGGHLKWALLGALRDCATVKVGWPYQRPGQPRIPRLVDPRTAFLRRVSWMADDLATAGDSPRAIVEAGDARQPEPLTRLMQGNIAVAVVTSPPYLNNFDYADATRLELYFWGTVKSWREMTETVRSGMVVATTQQSRVSSALTSAKILATRTPQTWPRIQLIANRLKGERAIRPRGKEYDLLVVSYFADLWQVVRNISQHVAKGAPVVLVLGDSAPYGIHVDTPALLTALSAELGFDHVETATLRRRGLRWQSNGSRHSVDLHERMVVLRSPGGH